MKFTGNGLVADTWLFFCLLFSLFRLQILCENVGWLKVL